MTRNTVLGIVVSVLVVAGVWYAYTHPLPATPPVSSTAEESVIRNVVTDFGTKLQMVPLLASTTARKAAMEAQYGPYVTPELIATWAPEGSEALGRYASSPWPEKIDIVEVRPEGKNFVVEGNVIEVVHSDVNSTEAAAVYPVTLTLEQRDGRWLITSVVKGAYSELPQRRTIIGYWECLPHKDTTGPQTLECAFGIAVDQSDGHYAIDTRLMAMYPVDFPTGTKVRVTGVVTPANQLSSVQKYDIDGIISATTIEKI
jgi:hypothetical protein